MVDERGASGGFTLIEILVVCSILGVLALMAFPSVTRFTQTQETKASAVKIAGALEEARSRAVSEATPHLVFFNAPSAPGSGSCGAMAVVVRDSDRSYSITEGDRVREIELDPKACGKVAALGESGSASEAEVPLPWEDQSERGLELEDPNSSSSGSGSDGSSGSGSGGSSGKGSGETVEAREEKAADAVVNGATFPIDADSGRPVIAFSERGIPVDPANPGRWGSGAGAVYLTDENANVYAAVVEPMGGVKVRAFERAKGTWR